MTVISITDILALVTSILGTTFSVMFVVNLLFWVIITGILARILGAYSIFDGAPAGAINYVISTIGMSILTWVIGTLSPWILLAVIYGASTWVVMHFTELDLIRGIIVAVGTNYLTPIVFSFVFSMVR